MILIQTSSCTKLSIILSSSGFTKIRMSRNLFWFLLLASLIPFPWDSCLAEKQLHTRDTVSSFQQPTTIKYIDGSYYLGNRKLEFGSIGYKLADELITNPASRRLALSAQRKYKAGNIVLIPTFLLGTVLLASGLNSERNSNHVSTFEKPLGAILILSGVSVNFLLKASGRAQYEIAIKMYNENPR